MKDFYEQRDKQRGKTKKKKRSKLVLLALFVMLVLIARGAVNAYSKETDSAAEVARVLKEKETLQKRYDIISDENDSLKSDAGVESEIRSKFDVAKSGEGVIIIVDKEIPIIEEDKRGVLKRFWDSVKGVFSSDSSGSASRASTSPAKSKAF